MVQLLRKLGWAWYNYYVRTYVSRRRARLGMVQLLRTYIIPTVAKTKSNGESVLVRTLEGRYSSIGLRSFEHLHAFLPELEINEVLMAVVSGRVSTVLTLDSELARFADQTFDVIIIAHITHGATSLQVDTVRNNKLKHGGRILHINKDQYG